jgi:NAD(P)-dependent dehydrogenase (short-subunit alcohol dehydrogenase family)
MEQRQIGVGRKIMAGDRIAVVPGGASGIGEATARRMARDGDIAVICDMNEASGEVVVEEIRADGGAAHFYKLDVADREAIAEVAARIEADIGPVGALVNSAGILENPQTTEDMDLEYHDRIWQVNYHGTLHCCRSFGHRMVAREVGTIVNLASVNSFHILPLPGYSPSKVAIKGLTELLAAEFGRAGVRVNAVAPTYTMTPALKSRIQSGHRDPEQILDSGALRVFVEPQDIADGIYFLCSPAARVITGVTLPIDAGWLATIGYRAYVGGRPWEAKD